MSLAKLFVEDYRPATLADTILPETVKAQFEQFVKEGEIPSLLFHGSGGVGKTTVARALCAELKCDYIVINGSEDNGIDMLRTKVKSFASTVSLSSESKHKVIILDEADYLSAAAQPALRGLIEEFSGNCRFIFTCNYINKIIPALHSRCSVVNFEITKTDKPKMALAFYKRVCMILDENDIEYDAKPLIQFINFHFPDMRRILNELQRYGMNGKIDVGILSTVDDSKFIEIVGYLKDKNFKEMRNWITENSADPATIFGRLYDTAYTYIQPNDIPTLVVILAEYQYKNSFVANSDINMAACFCEIMSEVNFK